jgi:hypothetical protein
MSEAIALTIELNQLETEYAHSFKAYLNLNYAQGWRSARAHLDYLEDCIRQVRCELNALGICPPRTVVVSHH